MTTVPEATVTRLPSSGVFAQESVLRRYLDEQLGVSLRFAELPTLKAFFVGSRHARGRHSLVVAEDLPPASRIHLYLHIAGHIQLGHVREFSVLFEARGPSEEGHREADATARAVWWSYQPRALNVIPAVDAYLGRSQTPAPGQLLGARFALIAPHLSHRPIRTVLLGSLRLARRVFHLLPQRHVLGNSGFVGASAALLSLTEVVNAAPELSLKN